MLLKAGDALARDWEAIFAKHDKDGSGSISLEELIGVVRRELRVPKGLLSNKQVGMMFAHFDSVGEADGKLSMDEFLELLRM